MGGTRTGYRINHRVFLSRQASLSAFRIGQKYWLSYLFQSGLIWLHLFNFFGGYLVIN